MNETTKLEVLWSLLKAWAGLTIVFLPVIAISICALVWISNHYECDAECVLDRYAVFMIECTERDEFKRDECIILFSVGNN